MGASDAMHHNFLRLALARIRYTKALRAVKNLAVYILAHQPFHSRYIELSFSIFEYF